MKEGELGVAELGTFLLLAKGRVTKYATYLAEERVSQENLARAIVYGEKFRAIAKHSLLYSVRYAVSVFVSGAHCNYSSA